VIANTVARFGDRDGEGEDTFVETRHDSLNVEVLAEEDLTRSRGSPRPTKISSRWRP